MYTTLFTYYYFLFFFDSFFFFAHSIGLFASSDICVRARYYFFFAYTLFYSFRFVLLACRVECCAVRFVYVHGLVCAFLNQWVHWRYLYVFYALKFTKFQNLTRFCRKWTSRRLDVDTL